MRHEKLYKDKQVQVEKTKAIEELEDRILQWKANLEQERLAEARRKDRISRQELSVLEWSKRNSQESCQYSKVYLELQKKNQELTNEEKLLNEQL